MPLASAVCAFSHPSSPSCSSSSFSFSASVGSFSLSSEVKGPEMHKEGKEREVKGRLFDEKSVVPRVSAPAVGMDVHVPVSLSLRSTPQSLLCSLVSSLLFLSPHFLVRHLLVFFWLLSPTPRSSAFCFSPL